MSAVVSPGPPSDTAHRRTVVLVKQVPQVASLRFDPERRRAVRDDVPLVLNAYDRRALGEALRLRGLLGGEVVVLTLGPPAARKALEECLALGADRAIHLLDPAFAGGDALATARALAAAIGPLAPDLVLCGQRSVDAETSQVGPALAELLDLPQVTAVARATPLDDGRAVRVERLTDDGHEVLRVPLPCLLTAAERLHRPEAADARPAPRPGGAPIETRTAADLGLAPEQVGEAGSLTWVRGLRSVETPRRRELLEGTPEAIVARVIDVIAGTSQPPRPAPFARREGGGAGRSDRRHRRSASHADVLLFAERHPNGGLRPSARQLVDRAALVAAGLGGRTVGLLAGGERLRDDARELAELGADLVLPAEDSALADYTTEPYAWLLARTIRERRPALVLLAATAIGRDLAPRVAARLGLGLVSDCEDVRLEPDGRLTLIRPSLGGGMLAEVETRTTPAMATMRAHPGRSGSERGARGRSQVEPLDVSGLPSARTTPLEARPDATEDGPDLETAEIVIGVGSGIGGPERLADIRRLASALGGGIGGTRKAVDLGWLPPRRQLGLSGRQVGPRVYLAIGIRGSFNHAIGIRRSGTVVAINNDPRAEIFAECDLGIVADWREIVPALAERAARLGRGAARHPSLATRRR